MTIKLLVANLSQKSKQTEIYLMKCTVKEMFISSFMKSLTGNWVIFGRV